MDGAGKTSALTHTYMINISLCNVLFKNTFRTNTPTFLENRLAMEELQ
jgi:hypothetical protein